MKCSPSFGMRTTARRSLWQKTNPILADPYINASLKLPNLRESAWKKLHQKIMKIALLGKDSIHWVIRTLCSKQRKSQILKQWRTKGGKPKWRAKERSSRRDRKNNEQANLLRWWTSDMSSMLNWNQNFRITQARSYSEATLWKTIQAIMQYSQGRVRLASQSTAANVMDVIARLPMGRTSSRCSIRVHSSQDGGRSNRPLLRARRSEVRPRSGQRKSSQQIWLFPWNWKLTSRRADGIWILLIPGDALVSAGEWTELENPVTNSMRQCNLCSCVIRFFLVRLNSIVVEGSPLFRKFQSEDFKRSKCLKQR